MRKKVLGFVLASIMGCSSFISVANAAGDEEKKQSTQSVSSKDIFDDESILEEIGMMEDVKSASTNEAELKQEEALQEKKEKEEPKEIKLEDATDRQLMIGLHNRIIRLEQQNKMLLMVTMALLESSKQEYEPKPMTNEASFMFA